MRARGCRVPILMLTARDGVADRISGLDAGADDYVVKPFAYEEVSARLRALARRAADTTLPGRRRDPRQRANRARRNATTRHG